MEPSTCGIGGPDTTSSASTRLCSPVPWTASRASSPACSTTQKADWSPRRLTRPSKCTERTTWLWVEASLEDFRRTQMAEFNNPVLVLFFSSHTDGRKPPGQLEARNTQEKEILRIFISLPLHLIDFISSNKKASVLVLNISHCVSC